MGADAKLFLFDYELYGNSVVPTFLRHMSGGLDGSMAARTDGYSRGRARPQQTCGVRLRGFNPVGFWTFVPTSIQNSAVTRTFDRPKAEYSGSWEAGVCTDAVCPLRGSFPFHKIQGRAV